MKKKKGKKSKKFPEPISSISPAIQLIGSHWCTKGGGHPCVLDFCHCNTVLCASVRIKS